VAKVRRAKEVNADQRGFRRMNADQKRNDVGMTMATREAGNDVFKVSLP
jgi:hypothetical protein